MDNKYVVIAIVAVSGILLLGTFFVFMSTRDSNGTSSTKTIAPGTEINRNDVMTNNKFDLDKFNRKYNEIKAKRKEAYRKREAERLAKMQELNGNREQDGVKVLDMKVYDILVDYSRSMQGVMVDITNGRPWIHNNRLLYLGWTFIIVSVVYFTINNI